MGRLTLAFLKVYLDGVDGLAGQVGNAADDYPDTFSTYLAP